MAVQLFPDFLGDKGQYALAEGYWRNLWEEIARSSGQRGEWKTPWLRTSFSNGTPFQDGDPIFSAVATERGLGVRVIQHEPETDEVELDSWVETFDGPDSMIRVLVLSCALTDEIVGYVQDLFRSWIIQGEVHVVRELEGPVRIAPPNEIMQWRRPRVPA